MLPEFQVERWVEVNHSGFWTLAESVSKLATALRLCEELEAALPGRLFRVVQVLRETK